MKRRVEEAVGGVLGHGRRFPGEAIAELQRCVVDELQADVNLGGVRRPRYVVAFLSEYLIDERAKAAGQ